MLHVAECRENGDIYKEVEPGGGGETCRGSEFTPPGGERGGEREKNKTVILCVGATPVSRKGLPTSGAETQVFRIHVSKTNPAVALRLDSSCKPNQKTGLPLPVCSFIPEKVPPPSARPGAAQTFWEFQLRNSEFWN